MKTKIGVSACLLGAQCNFNGKDLLSPFVHSLLSFPDLEMISFCPEDRVFGTPRANLRIVGGDGFDVLNGNARVIDESGIDVTAKQVQAAELFHAHLESQNITHAILMDGSPSCGSNVLLAEEYWPKGGFKKGHGVSAAFLKNKGVTVLSSFDEASIAKFISTITSQPMNHSALKDLKDHPKFAALLASKEKPH